MNLGSGASDASNKRLQRLGSAARPRPLNRSVRSFRQAC
jgi:hypothetical protein